MSFEHYVILALFVFTCFREVMHFVTTDRLENKLMSRNYYDYEISKSVSEPAKPTAKQQGPIYPIDPGQDPNAYMEQFG